MTALSPALLSSLARPLEQAVAAVARLDGALIGCPLLPAWHFRVRIAAAVTQAGLDGIRVDPARLGAAALGLRPEAPAALGATGPAESSRDGGATAHALRLLHWSAPARSDSAAGDGETGADADGPTGERIAAALAGLDRDAGEMPTLIAAALGLRRWIERGGERPALWAALPRFLMRRGLLRAECPLLLGAAALRGRSAWEQPTGRWVATFLDGVCTEAGQALGLLLDLERCWHAARSTAEAHSRSHSRLPQVVDLLALAPAVNPEGVARALSGGRDPRRSPPAGPASTPPLPSCSPRGAGKMLDKLEALGLVVELSGRGTHKLYALTDLAPLRQQSARPLTAKTATKGRAGGPADLSWSRARLDLSGLDTRGLDDAAAEVDAVLRRLAARLDKP
ncbi:hypothetical protein [Rhodospirillum centenum]|uniref:Uncharacterized protein n=1 Tax=Rhodospirillum centenum (strain ATCC 51521 / SW) TaxID=414684 RepID=B6IXS2_RHOCS|nr:hypothetical protein [Rhodospirillum centenum]ACJ01096.1 conserved hypothetical protein [Rhodospirillum centenum SW]